MHGKEAVKNSNLFLLDEIASGSPKLDLKSMLSLERSLQKIITDLPLQMEHSLLYCLSKQNFLLRVSGKEDGSRYWYTKYLESLLGWHASSRWRLGDQSFQDVALAPALAVQSASYV
eukprot:TRINITY_DN20004_c0_g2_i1.p2 TRINITY_DN20004_c0_g2~~TRINITY_DN20004_c0_g2_i1.p2  ORF type:complete len:117 (+),score=19.82 TRINITY_DN20004_c0_g2_i1:410-760(+)